MATYLDGMWSAFLSGGAWRPLLLPPVVIIYILVVAPIMARSDAEAIRAFRPLVLIDDVVFHKVMPPWALQKVVPLVVFKRNRELNPPQSAVKSQCDDALHLLLRRLCFKSRQEIAIWTTN